MLGTMTHVKVVTIASGHRSQRRRPSMDRGGARGRSFGGYVDLVAWRLSSRARSRVA
jgi:hypothetical protein